MENRVLVGDIGGTNVRFGHARLGASGRPELEEISVLPGDRFCCFDDALQTYLAENEAARQSPALFAFAGPVSNGVVRLTNRDWTIDRRKLAAKTGLSEVKLVNDYAAMARAVPELDPGSFRVLHSGNLSRTRAPMLVAGPGTGLGMATLVPTGRESWHVITGEGGHSAFAPRTDREWALYQQLLKKHDYVSKELVLSGSGFDSVHRALCEIDGVEWIQTSPAEILERADDGDPIAQDICQIRASATLDALGNAALINGAQGGVVITGGVAEHLVDWLLRPSVLARFFQRGPMSDYMTPIPIRLLLRGEAALIGAAALHFDGGART